MPSHQIMVLLWEMESTSTGQGAREAGWRDVGAWASWQAHLPSFNAISPSSAGWSIIQFDFNTNYPDFAQTLQIKGLGPTK